ncbi:cytochrome C oxidase subunit IV family protein [Echinicola sp. CAU 1574]|uniref:Cytochrome C oxidase subunit IV family protein n=1 Tax=Echinicola arenosa TaxID=2774144 RepID=A0ABR9AJ15_9BACT|nr:MULTISPECIES: cytochrome C oxidase subunit IV family protein [Echinicola]MBD8487848.1 cytochrome C oxidase subunit IV family protein [Echinicola arenosa]
MSLHENNSTLEVLPRNKEKIKKIWKTALILLVITSVEFLLAFTMERGMLLFAIFIGLTLVKAAYIMMEFMHLKDESKTLFWSIMLPLIFLVWLLIALSKEGADIFMYRW